MKRARQSSGCYARRRSRAKPDDPIGTLELFDVEPLGQVGGRAVDESDTPRARREKPDRRLVHCDRCDRDVLPGPHTLPQSREFCTRRDVA